MRIGYKLMSEEHGPKALVANARAAEEAGFDFVAISDHYHPWIEEEGHAPFAWGVLGAIAQATERVELCTAVTCPTFRYHPAVVAQAAATVALLADGRFTLGLGSGELLNEHVVGPRWPAAAERLCRVGEAVAVIRALLEGRGRSFHGTYFTIDDAALFDRPETPPTVALAASGPVSARLAGARAGALFATEPDPELVKHFREAGGEGPRYAEVGLCWAPTRQEAIDTAWRYQRWSLLGWGVMPDIPGTRGFAAATAQVRPEDLAGALACGPDLESHVASVRPYAEAGFDHLVLMQPGPEQEGFLRFFREELGPALRETLPH